MDTRILLESPMRRTFLCCLLFASSGCVTPGDMVRIAPDAGVEVRYDTPAESLLSALPKALRGRGLRIEQEIHSAHGAEVIASKGANFFSYGAFVRLRVSDTLRGDTAVAHLVARSRYKLDLSGQTDRVVPRLLQAIDDSLGGTGIGPFPGMRVRGRTADPDRRSVSGVVVAGSPGGFDVVPGPGTQGTPIPMRTLSDVSVFRGAYTHRSEGATVGVFTGLLVGLAIGVAVSEPGPDRGVAAGYGMILGMAGGMGIGIGIGAAIRTEVWSPVGPAR